MLMGGVKPDDAWDYSSEQTGLFKLNDFVTSSELAQVSFCLSYIQICIYIYNK